MASQLKVDTLTGVTTAGSIDVTSGSVTTNLQQGLCKAWAEIDGDASTVVAFDSFNTSSFDDDGTGLYTFHLSSSMSDANYCTATNAALNGAINTSNRTAAAAAEDSNSVLIGCRNLSNSPVDAQHIGGVLFGDLA